MASPATLDGQGIQRHTSPANHRIPHTLDALRGEKTRSGVAERLPFGSVLMTGTASEMDIFTVGAVIVAAMAAAEMVNRLSRKGFRRESSPGDDNLAMFIFVSGISGLEAGHLAFKPRFRSSDPGKQCCWPERWRIVQHTGEKGGKGVLGDT